LWSLLERRSVLANLAAFGEASVAMKSIGWARFSWEAKDLPDSSRYIISETYSLRSASRQEKSLVSQVIHSCFAQESCWNDVASKLVPRLHQEVEEKFAHHRESDCLVITHGNRVIAASIVDTGPSSDNHLLTGPCITVEYRNRGFGALLLKESLLLASQGGAEVLYGITRANSPAARFVYPKYGGVSVPYEVDLGLGQSSMSHWAG
jgi:N-acetylglutamate synthase-like GNAT family acetyltransferase